MELRYLLLKDNPYHPTKGTTLSACYDLYLPNDLVLLKGDTVTAALDIAFEIPPNYCMKIYPRSSLLSKYGIIAPVSIIDEDYTSSVHAVLYNTNLGSIVLRRGQRILQFMLVHCGDYEVIPTQYIADRGRGGLGSTDKEV